MILHRNSFVLICTSFFLLGDVSAYATERQNESDAEIPSEDDSKANEGDEAIEATASALEPIKQEPELAADQQRPKPMDGLPIIKAHTELRNTVYQGDKIVFGVVAEGSGLFYRWIRNYKTICSAARCKFDSSKWGVGTQNITVLIYNRYGSQTLSYQVRVLARPLDRPFSEVEPPSTKAEFMETLTTQDIFIKAVKGIGYSFQERSDVRVVAQMPRAMKWDETVRAHVKGVVQLGIKQQEEHLLMQGTSVKLLKTKHERRLIKLNGGVLRSRQLSEKDPLWSIIVGDWLQVDGDEKVDLYVALLSEDRRSATVTVMRGNARILLKSSDDTSNVKTVVLTSGLSQSFSLDADSEKHLPDVKTNILVVKNSTPQYFLKKKNERGGVTSFLTADIKSKSDQSLADAMKNARNALEAYDGFLALENLLPLYAQNTKNFDVQMLMARAYAVLELYAEAFKYLREAGKIRPKDPEVPYQIGHLYVRAGNWKKAISYLERARSSDHKDFQGVNYQLGVSHYNIQETHAARNYFRYAMWRPKNAEIKQSTEAYLTGLDDARWVGANASLRLGKDSNVYRWGKGARTEGYDTTGALFYEGALDLFVRGYASEQGEIRFGFDIVKTVYTESALAEVAPLTQKLYLNWTLNIGAKPEEKALVQFVMKPYVQLISLGDERSSDNFVFDLRMGFPRTKFSPFLNLTYVNASDPIPARNDKLDPFLMEPVLPSDRSTFISGLGLGFDLIKSSKDTLTLLMTQETSKHTASEIKIDDYVQRGLGVAWGSLAMHRIQCDLNLTYLTRSFESSDDSRKDSVIRVLTGADYMFTPAFAAELDIEYNKQTSNRDISDYKRSVYSLGISLEI